MDVNVRAMFVPVAVLILLALSLSTVASSRSAQLRPLDSTCPSQQSDFVGYTYNGSPSDMDGIRAPIKNRTDGLLCADAGSESAFAATYIAIEANNSNNLVQIGFIHDFGANGVGEWCRVWANGVGVANDYDCNGDPDDTFVYYRIETWCSSQGCVYQIEDCGTAGNFDDCTVENRSQPQFTSAFAAALSETDYSCTIRMMGQGSDRVWYGNASWNVDTEDANGWAQRTWTAEPANCSIDYLYSSDSDGLRTWDSRNAG